jgi:hypothetical protein
MRAHQVGCPRAGRILERSPRRTRLRRAFRTSWFSLTRLVLVAALPVLSVAHRAGPLFSTAIIREFGNRAASHRQKQLLIP